MAIILTNPDSTPGAATTGYQLQNELLYAGNTGFCNVNISNDYSKMLEGSIFETGGHLVKCMTDETIVNINNIANNNYFYV
jgi:hypothetical protein